jgi:hypothetical protein
MATNNFDFEKYNEVMKNANSGLKLYLAEQLLLDVQSTFVRFKNPLQSDMRDVVSELADVRTKNKKMAEAAQRTTSGEIDNANVPNPEGKPIDSYANKHGSKAKDHKETAVDKLLKHQQSKVAA